MPQQENSFQQYCTQPAKYGDTIVTVYAKTWHTCSVEIENQNFFSDIQWSLIYLCRKFKVDNTLFGRLTQAQSI